MRVLCFCIFGLLSCTEIEPLPECIDLPLDSEGCPSACELYCDHLVTNCRDLEGFGEDDRVAQCTSQCREQGIPQTGEIGALKGDTMQCRLAHAVAAADDATTHCKSAQFNGGDQCVDERCFGYCEAMETACAGAYSSQSDCRVSCGAFPQADTAMANTVQCRYDFALAAADGNSEHCGPASLEGGGVCGAPCEAYCDQVFLNCRSAYESKAACADACEGQPGGRYDDWLPTRELATVACRAHHAAAPAWHDPSTHCPHVLFDNSQHCTEPYVEEGD